MHKNTFFFLLLLSIVAALLVGFNVGKKWSGSVIPAAGQSTTPALSPTPKEQAMQTYTSAECGISFQYPAEFTKLEASAGAMFLDPQSASSSVALACQDEIPRPPIPADQIEFITLEATSGATVSGRLYHDASAKDGTPVDELIFTHPKTRLDVFLSGFGPVFDQILKSLQVL